MRLVTSADEDIALGPGWLSSPDEFPKRSRITKLLTYLEPLWGQSEWAVKSMSRIVAFQKMMNLKRSRKAGKL